MKWELYVSGFDLELQPFFSLLSTKKECLEKVHPSVTIPCVCGDTLAVWCITRTVGRTISKSSAAYSLVI